MGGVGAAGLFHVKGCEVTTNQSLNISIPNQYSQIAETQRQKYIMQQNMLYANSGSKLKTNSNQIIPKTTTTINMPSSSSQNNNQSYYDNVGWVFLKNESFSGPITQGGPNLMAQNISYKKRLQKLQELNRSAVQSDNTSLDSPANNYNDKSIISAGQNFAEIIQRHQQMQKDDSVEVDMTQLQEYQQQYKMDDDDSPTLILEKVAQQVHDQMCGGVVMNNTSIKSNSLNNIPIKVQNQKVTQKNSSNHLQMDSYESKNNTLHFQEAFDRIPKINGFNAKIKTVANSNQNSARLSHVIGQISNNTNNLNITPGVINNKGSNGSSGSNFQSFKKNAMKLPKVSMRTSLLNQISNQKTSSLPISPRMFESSKYGSSSNHKKSLNNSQQNDSFNAGVNDNSFNQVNPFALPQIATTLQSANHFDINLPQNLNHSTQANSNFENQLTQISINNRSSFLKDVHNKLVPTETDIGESRIDLNNINQQNSSIQTSSNLQESSFLITEAKLESNYKARFTLNTLRNRVQQQSPLQNQTKFQQIPQQQFYNQQERNSSTGTHSKQQVIQNEFNQKQTQFSSNNTIVLAKIQRQSQNDSGLLLNPINTNNQTTINQANKVCSSCHKKTQPKKQFSFDLQNIEALQASKQSLNQSCFSDGQIYDNQQPSSSLQQRAQLSKNSLNKIIIDNFNEYDGTKYLNEYSRSPQYNRIRDNKFFHQFASQYNNQLIHGFEEADKKCKPNKKPKHDESPLPSMKHDLIAYMEQHSDIRKQIKEEAEQQLQTMKSQIKKIYLKKNQIQQLYDNNSNQMTAGTGTNTTAVDISDVLNANQDQDQSNIKQSHNKQSAMKNYGRWYLKPQEFNRLINNMKSKQGNSGKKQLNESNVLNQDQLEEDTSATFIDEFNITMNSSNHHNKRNSSLH